MNNRLAIFNAEQVRGCGGKLLRAIASAFYERGNGLGRDLVYSDAPLLPHFDSQMIN